MGRPQPHLTPAYQRGGAEVSQHLETRGLTGTCLFTQTRLYQSRSPATGRQLCWWGHACLSGLVHRPLWPGASAGFEIARATLGTQNGRQQEERLRLGQGDSQEERRQSWPSS